jgi:hypothetical protein
LHVPEQQLAPASSPHASPLGKQEPGGSMHRPLSHRPPQQSLSLLHDVPAVRQIVPPQVPALHASEQHEAALSQDEPLDPQKAVQVKLSEGPWGSQRLLQHSLRAEQTAPGAWHVPPGRQKPDSHRLLQQSVGKRHATPSELH